MTKQSKVMVDDEARNELEISSIEIDRLRAICDPYLGCWLDIDSPIQMDEVERCLSRGEEFFAETERNIFLPPAPDARAKHIQKIAYFSKYGFKEPLLVDVGIPEMGCFVEYILDDGNHRFAAAIFRKERLGIAEDVVPVTVCGSLKHAEEIGVVSTRPACFQVLPGDSLLEHHSPGLLA